MRSTTPSPWQRGACYVSLSIKSAQSLKKNQKKPLIYRIILFQKVPKAFKEIHNAKEVRHES